MKTEIKSLFLILIIPISFLAGQNNSYNLTQSLKQLIQLELINKTYIHDWILYKSACNTIENENASRIKQKKIKYVEIWEYENGNKQGKRKKYIKYDINGNIIEEFNAELPVIGDKLVIYSYDKLNNRIFSSDSTKLTVVRTETKYNNDGFVDQIITSTGIVTKTSRFVYDNGKLTKCEITTTSPSKSSMSYVAYEYNDKNEVKETYFENNIPTLITYKDSLGNILKETSIAGNFQNECIYKYDGLKYRFQEEYNNNKKSSSFACLYDKNDRIIGTIDIFLPDMRTQTDFIYDNSGNIVEVKRGIKMIKYIFNKEGLVLNKKEVDANNSVDTNYFYDKQGNLISVNENSIGTSMGKRKKLAKYLYEFY